VGEPARTPDSFASNQNMLYPWAVMTMTPTLFAAAVWRTLEITHTTSWCFERLHHARGMLERVAPTITHPADGAVLDSPSFTVSGRHNNPTGIYWLTTTNNTNDYWPKGKIHFRPNGQWDENITTSKNVKSTILLVKVSPLLDILLEQWQQNARKNQWEKLHLPPTATKGNMIRIDWVVVNVR